MADLRQNGLTEPMTEPAGEAPGRLERLLERAFVVPMGGRSVIDRLRFSQAGEAADVRTTEPEVALDPEAQRYRVLGELGRGGMGRVLQAHDVDLDREVAIKVLLDEHAGRPALVERFVGEARIAGRLQHPGIVPVYELGMDRRERPFFTMKLVGGRTLAELLHERPEPAHELRRFLTIFEQVCHAVAFAHAQGVIHRDLKPSNVMVGTFGEVQVVDWGLAKPLSGNSEIGPPLPSASVMSTTDRSSAGSVLGTPAYMAPEQARGDLAATDERSDVFSLGAMLCEILTGRPAYVGATPDEVKQIAANAELADAVAHIDSAQIDQELAALAKSCLAPRPEARPRNGEELAQRISAYLAATEERARRASLEAAVATARAASERKARRLTEGLTASLLGLLLVGGGGWLWLARQARDRMRTLEVRISSALEQATLARGERRWDAALSALGQADAFAAMDDAPPEVRSKLASLRATIAREADTAALVLAMQDMRQPEGDRPYGPYPADWKALDARYVALLARHGLDFDSGNEHEAAQQIAARGATIDLAAALDEWAVVRQVIGDAPGAARLLRVASSIDRDEMRGRLRDASLRGDAQLLRAIATDGALERMPIASQRLVARACRLDLNLNQEIAVLQTAAHNHPGDFTVAMELGRAMLRATPPRREDAVRCFTVARALRPASVEAWHELGLTLDQDMDDDAAAVDVFRGAVSRWPKDAHLHWHLGKALGGSGDIDGAIKSGREATDLDPRDARARYNLGVSLDKKGDADGALDCYRQATMIDEAYAPAHYNLGNKLHTRGDIEGAIASYRKAIELASQYMGMKTVLNGSDDGDISVLLARMHTNLGIALRTKGELDEAMAHWRTAIDLDSRLANARTFLAEALEATGKRDEAIAFYEATIDIDPRSVVAHNNLGGALHRNGDVDKAIASFRRAIELDPTIAMVHVNLAIVLKEKGEFDEAIACYRKAIELEPKVASRYNDLGSTLQHRQGDIDKAIECYKRAIVLDPRYGLAYHNLGVALKSKGELEAAIENYQKAIDLGHPRAAAASFELGLLYAHLRRHEESLAALRAAEALGAQLPAGLLAREQARAERDAWLDGLVAGKVSSDEGRDWVEAASFCAHTSRWGEAVYAYERAFTLDRKLGDDMRKRARLQAARAAAKGAMQDKALAWLVADVVRIRSELDKGERPAARARGLLRELLDDASFADLRGDGLVKLGASEAEAWRALWRDVEAGANRAGS